MIRLTPKARLWLAATLALPLMVGACSEDENAKVARVATTAADRQSQQNQEVVRLNREVAETTKRLLGAEAESRKDLVLLQKDLQSQQAEVNRQRDLLEAERRELAWQRQWEPTFATALTDIGAALACLLPLALGWLVLSGLYRERTDAAVSRELLIEELKPGHSPYGRSAICRRCWSGTIRRLCQCWPRSPAGRCKHEMRQAGAAQETLTRKP